MDITIKIEASGLEQAIKALAAALTNTPINTLEATPQVTEPMPELITTATPVIISIDELRAGVASYDRKLVIAKLKEMGYSKLTEIPEEQRAALLTALA